MTAPVPPIGTQISALAAARPRRTRRHLRRAHADPRRTRPVDEPAGPRLRRTRCRRRRLRDDRAAQLDRVDPGRGGVLEARRRAAAAVAAAAAGHRVRPACCELRPPALLVGRDDPARSKYPACQQISPPTRHCPTPHCPKRCRRCGRRWGRAAAPAGPSSSSPAATAGYLPRSAIRWAPRRATPLGPGAAEPQHRLHRGDRSRC